jgi:hypothetical protein
MQTLGEDILLLAIQQNGSVAAGEKIHLALAGSELVRLAALRRIEVVDGRIVVVDPTPTQDPLLDATFAGIQDSKRPALAKDWVTRRQPRMTRDYLDRLAASGAARYEVRRALGLFRSRSWFVADFARVSALKARLDEIALSSGPVDASQAAFGGLIQAIGLDAVLYPKNAGRAARNRLQSIAEYEAAGTTRYAMAEVPAAADCAPDAAAQAATEAATREVVQVAIRAVVQASVAARNGTTISATMSASANAAVLPFLDTSSTEGGHHHG